MTGDQTIEDGWQPSETAPTNQPIEVMGIVLEPRGQGRVAWLRPTRWRPLKAAWADPETGELRTSDDEPRPASHPA